MCHLQRIHDTQKRLRIVFKDKEEVLLSRPVVPREQMLVREDPGLLSMSSWVTHGRWGPISYPQGWCCHPSAPHPTSGTTKLTWTKDSDVLALVSEREGLILKASQSTLCACDCSLGLHAGFPPPSLPREGRLGIARSQVPAAPRGNL